MSLVRLEVLGTMYAIAGELKMVAFLGPAESLQLLDISSLAFKGGWCID